MTEGLGYSGGKQLQEAVIHAFEVKNYALALRASAKAIKAIPEILNPAMITKEEDVITTRELTCYIYFMAGSVRAHVLVDSVSGKYKASKADSNELQYTEQYLRETMNTSCVIKGISGELLTYSALAYNTLLQLLENQDFIAKAKKGSVIDQAVKYTKLASAHNLATDMHLKYAKLRKELMGSTREAMESTKQAMNAARLAVKWYDEAGQEYFDQEKYSEAIVSFESAMQFGMLGQKKSMEVHSSTATSTGKDLPSGVCPCSVKYWYVHSLAAIEGFATNVSKLEAAIQSLKYLTSNKCSKDPSVDTDMRNLAKSQLSKLQNTLHDLLTSDPISTSSDEESEPMRTIEIAADGDLMHE